MIRDQQSIKNRDWFAGMSWENSVFSRNGLCIFDALGGFAPADVAAPDCDDVALPVLLSSLSHCAPSLIGGLVAQEGGIFSRETGNFLENVSRGLS